MPDVPPLLPFPPPGPIGDGFRPPPPPEWEVKLREKAEQLTGKQGEIARRLAPAKASATFPPPASDPQKENRELLTLIGWNRDASLEDVVRPEGDLYQAVAALIGVENAELARQAWLRSPDYAIRFDNGRYLLSGPIGTRTRKLPSLHIVSCLENLKALIRNFAGGFSLEKSVADIVAGEPAAPDPRSPGFNAPIPLIGWYLDEKDGDGTLLAGIKALLEKRRSQIRPQGYAVDMRVPVSWLYASRRPEAHKIAADLACDNTLPDMLRAQILEECARWTVEGFSNTLKALNDNGGIRGNDAVANAMLAWLGLDRSVINGEQQSDAFEIAYDCLTNPERIRQSATSDVGFWLYMAFWAQSQLEIADLLDTVNDRIRNGIRIQKVHALNFLATQLYIPQFQLKAAMPVLADPASREDETDSVLLALAVQCAGGMTGKLNLALIKEGVTDYDGKSNLIDEPTEAIDGTRLREVFLTREETKDLYLSLKSIVDWMIAAKVRDRGGFVDMAEETPRAFTRAQVFGVMSSLLRRDTVRKPLGFGPFSAQDETGTAGAWGLKVVTRRSTFENGVRDALDDDFDGLNLRDDLCSYLPEMGAARDAFIGNVVADGVGGPAQRAALVRTFAHSPMQAWMFSQKLDLTDSEYRIVEDAFKNVADKDVKILYLALLRREPDGLGTSVKRLLADSDPKKRKAGQELVVIMANRKDDPLYASVYQECLAAADAQNGDSGHKRIANAHTPDETNGFDGLYDAGVPYARFDFPAAPDTTSGDAGAKLFTTKREELFALLDAVRKTVDENAAYAYKVKLPWSEKIMDFVLGVNGLEREYRPDEDPVARAEREKEAGREGAIENLDPYPLADAWREMLRSLNPTPQCLTFFALINNGYAFPTSYPNPAAGVKWWEYAYEIKQDVDKYRMELFKDSLLPGRLSGPLLGEVPEEVRYPVIRDWMRAIMTIPVMENDVAGLGVALRFWAGYLRSSVKENDGNFIEFFRLLYEYQYGDAKERRVAALLTPEDFARAYRLGALPENDFIRALTAYGRSGRLFEPFTDPEKRAKLEEAAPGIGVVIDRIVDKAVEIEAKRGELDTRMSYLAGAVVRYEGTRHFVEALASLGDAPLDNKYNWNRWKAVSGDAPKGRMLTHLILVGYPAPGEDAGTLAECLKDVNVTDERLREAAGFAPQWKEMADAYLRNKR